MDPFHYVAWCSGEELYLGHIYPNTYSRIALVLDVKRNVSIMKETPLLNFFVVVKVPGLEELKEVKDVFDMQ